MWWQFVFQTGNSHNSAVAWYIWWISNVVDMFTTFGTHRDRLRTRALPNWNRKLIRDVNGRHFVNFNDVITTPPMVWFTWNLCADAKWDADDDLQVKIETGSRISTWRQFVSHTGNTLSQKGYHPTTNHNFNNSCRIPVIFGTNIAEKISKGGLIYHLTYLLYAPYLGKL